MEYSFERAHKVPYIGENNITTIRNKRHMTYEFYIKQPMETVELRLILILDENPQLITSLDRSANPTLNIRKYSRFSILFRLNL